MKSEALGEICEINPKYDNGLNPNERCSFVPMEFVDDTSARIMQADERRVAEVQKGYTPFRNGDVILAKITPCLENGKCAIAKNLVNGIGFGSTEFHVLRAREQVTPEWLYYFVRQPSVRRRLALRMHGSAGQQRVPSDAIEELVLPLPALPEQQRIAGILDRADRMRRMRRYAQQMSETFLQAVFVRMFGDVRTNSMGWPIDHLESLIEPGDKINYGVVQPGDDYPNGVPIVRVGDFDVLNSSLAGLKRIDPSIEAKYKRSRLHGDEILVACVGSIGRVALIDGRARGFNIVRAVARIRCSNSVDRRYLSAYLATPPIQEYFNRETRTVNQPTLNIEQIEEAPVFLPPLALQEQFARIVQRFDRLRAQQREAERQAEQLFQALLQRAFSGGL